MIMWWLCAQLYVDFNASILMLTNEQVLQAVWKLHVAAN